MIKRAVSEISLNSGFGSRVYLVLRMLTCPFDRILKMVPARGRILDLGCGAGLFFFLLSHNAPERSIISVDCRLERIRAAGRAAETGGFKNISFAHGDIVSFPYPDSTDCIVLIDVLYQLSSQDKAEVIRKCSASLRKNGVLFVKETGTSPAWKFLWCYFQETVISRLLRVNLRRVEPLGAEVWLDIIGKEGFSAEIKKIDKGYSYPHVLFICRKTDA
ncbi:MAG: class I SAM-dependent methyltransferase [Candidatus Omnitrophota bacterium]|jgi:ubiquinone/menaquinone biosynthesis C-methylase UbiE